MPTRPPVTTTAPDAPARRDARALALHALVRIDTEGAYANLLLPQLLDRSGLDVRDRGFVTELVYGTTRMRRACDFLVDRFPVVGSRAAHAPDPAPRRYQLAFTRVKPHAAVDATVALAAKRHRGLVNAVLRKVAASEPRHHELARRGDAPVVPGLDRPSSGGRTRGGRRHRSARPDGRGAHVHRT
jgi:hypothetical protein